MLCSSPGHGHLSLMVEHLVASSGTGEEGEGDILAKYLGRQIQRWLDACQDLDTFFFFQQNVNIC